MAHLVLGLATSHSPQLSTPPEHWDILVEDDMIRPRKLIGIDGRPHAYDELLEAADSTLIHELEPAVWQRRYDACQRAIGELGAIVEHVRPDVVITLGDDQDEVLHEDNMPAFSVYWGETMPVSPRRFHGGPAYYQYSAWAYGASETAYPVRAELARHLIEDMSERGFDVAASHRLPDGKGIGHAFGFIQQRIMNCRPVPVIPIMLNTFYPPNQPTPRRCYDFGEALKGAIEGWPNDLRVCVVASGGLSHFVIDEDLDSQLLRGLRDHDRQRLAALPVERLQSGTSEARNWITLAGVTQELDMRVVDYIPCYRSPAGTGCAMGFATWQ
ncbi:MAG: hypothetical protein JO247_14845 [Chloroflexi bacterium]|nr:hypothetical protein [Chloroflexota bacterium]